MFIRKKTIKGQTYYYLVKSVRVKGKVQQKVLAYLGTFDLSLIHICQNYLKSR